MNSIENFVDCFGRDYDAQADECKKCQMAIECQKSACVTGNKNEKVFDLVCAMLCDIDFSVTQKNNILCWMQDEKIVKMRLSKRQLSVWIKKISYFECDALLKDGWYVYLQKTTEVDKTDKLIADLKEYIESFEKF